MSRIIGQDKLIEEVNRIFQIFTNSKGTIRPHFILTGGTFLGELEILKKKYPNGVYNIMVCHAVNPIGIKNLCEHFDNVIITNSFADFNTCKYKNLTVIDVCNNDN